VIERVIVPSSSKKDVTSSVKCFRLIIPDRNPDEDDVTVQPLEVDDDEKDAGNETTGGTVSTFFKYIELMPIARQR
jgi:hypothetical protein